MADVSISPSYFITSANANIVQGVAGEPITRGQPLYLNPDGKYYKAKANVTTNGKDIFIGCACEDADVGQQFLFVKSDPALQIGFSAASGDRVYLSGTNAGGMVKNEADLASGWRIWSLGVCTTAGAASDAIFNLAPIKGGIK